MLIQQAISSLVVKKAVIVIAYRLQSIMSADNIIVLKDGHVAEQSQAGNWRLTHAPCTLGSL